MSAKAINKADHESIEWYSEVPRSIRLQTSLGILLIAMSFGLGGSWALTAPLAGAIIAQGSFVATGSNKVIQHLEGGVIQKLNVNEGDRVHEGDQLVQLDPTAAAANERALKLRFFRLQTVVARLRAQAEGADKFDIPNDVKAAAGDPDITSIIEGQRVAFNSKQIKLRDQLNLIKKNILTLEFRNAGYESQKAAYTTQRALLVEERNAKTALLNKGFVSRVELLNVNRAIADAEGDIGQLGAQKNESTSQIEKFRQDAVIALNTNRQEALDALETAEGDLESVRQEMKAAKDVLDRMVIRSPVQGIVVRTYFNSSGGVVTTGKPIMEILPDNVPLIIEARVPRASIDQVAGGQPVSVRLTSLNRRTTPVISGKVFYVSADSVEADNRSAQKEAYIIRVQVPNSEIERLEGFRPVPGMPAEVLVQTSERTFFEYLTKPITDSMSRAFKEK